ncbi:MAG TPA: pyridoxal phosphate-dependent aminotransferase [Alphaproteobacteria bacterium]|jgi:aspartate/methionine/tyrosine aminotransferase|nr:pyridoxal phosphate-dependent aminotransferase [Alphaproteobacteria bacterium]HJO88790.1 pyridoxal phosphate-dependent aminotransferase [Alphaproteobacteria bacterium]
MLTPATAMSRLGTDSTFEVLARAKALEAQGKHIIHMGIGQPDFPTPAHIVEAACKALKDGHHGYTPAGGIPELREAVAADIAKYRGVEVDPDTVLIAPGGKAILFYTALMFGEEGTEVIYPDPGFLSYKSVITFSGATPIPLHYREESGFSFSAEELLSLITPRTRLIILNSPANPTGSVVPRKEIERLVEGLVEYPQVAVLSDEIYSRMLYDGHEHVSLLEFDDIRNRVILLDGWSKTYAMTGWRLGYGVFPPKLFEYVERLAINCHSCVSTASQYAGIAALTGPQDDVDRMVVAFDERRKRLVAGLNALPGFSCQKPGGAFYAFPNISDTGLGSKEIEEKLLNEAGVATVAGTSFGRYGEGFLRFSYAVNLKNIETALQRIGGEL